MWGDEGWGPHGTWPTSGCVPRQETSPWPIGMPKRKPAWTAQGFRSTCKCLIQVEQSPVGAIPRQQMGCAFLPKALMCPQVEAKHPLSPSLTSASLCLCWEQH